MKVLFLQNVLHVAKAWEIKEVKAWYASNMLFPKKLAIELTPDAEKQHKDKIAKQESHKRDLIENRYNIAESLTAKELSFKLQTSGNKVFWWIGEKDIISEIKTKFKIELSKSQINMPDWHLKKLWEHFVYIKLWKDAMVKIKVTIIPINQ